MSLYKTLEDQLRLILLNSVSDEYPDFNVIISHENGTEPYGTYGVVNILNLPKTGRAENSTLLNENFQLTTNIPYELFVQFSFVGSNAEEIAFHSHARIAGSALTREYSQSFNLGMMNQSALRRTPVKRETKWIMNAHFDVTFSLVVSYKQEVDYVQRVDYLDPFTEEVISVPPQ